MFEDALDGRYPPTGPLDANVRLLMARLILAASEQEFQRAAARGLGWLLHAQVAVASAGFRGELRQIAVIAAWVPRAYNPQLARPPGGGRPSRAVLVTAPLERAMPAYLLWRASAFTDRELVMADGVALALVALQLRWCAQRPANERPANERLTNEHSTNEQPARATTDGTSGGPVQRSSGAGGGRLTAREVVVLQHLSAGLSAASIARVSGISPRTVRKHLQHVYAKLDTHDRLLAVDVARVSGLIGAPPERPRSDPSDIRSLT